MKQSFCILILALVVGAAAGCATQPEGSKRCFWMENISGKFSWIDAYAVYHKQLSKQDCFHLDSCDGGQSASGGGCYKWANSPEGEREPW
jgi:hypothetical protein